MAICKKCGKEIPNGEKECKQCKQKNREFIINVVKVALTLVVGIGVKAIKPIAKLHKG